MSVSGIFKRGASAALATGTAAAPRKNMGESRLQIFIGNTNL
jgi:hypothetical protein